MSFFRKHHRDEFFKRQPLNKPIYRYRPLENPLFSLYEDYRYFGRSENKSDKFRTLNPDVYLNNEHQRPIKDDIDFLIKRKPYKERQIDRANLILSLYKQLLRYSNKLVYTNKDYYLRRVKDKFRTNKDLNDSTDIEFYYKGAIDRSKFPTLDEKDLEEHFINGSGPGGQSVNKRINCVFLKHKPTNLSVKVHEFRELENNRKQARKHLLVKLDNHLNGENSIEAQKKRINTEYERKAKESARLKREQKRILKKHLSSLGFQKSKETVEVDNSKQIELIKQLDRLKKVTEDSN